MSPLRARLIAAGLLRPWTKELPPIQLPPGTVVFKLQRTAYETALYAEMDLRAAWRQAWRPYFLSRAS